MRHRAIAIDGPAASGKSSLARLLARDLGVLMVNTGLMYRAVTWEVLEAGADPGSREEVCGVLEGMEVRPVVVGGVVQFRFDGRELGEELQGAAVNEAVSVVASVPEVRERLVREQRATLEFGDVVMEGRDIGTVVFPETPFKVYVDAREEVRQARRRAQGLDDEVRCRDARDSGRAASPLRVGAGARVVDTSDCSLEEAVEVVKGVLWELGW